MKNLLFIGDAGVPTGFARATHEILDTLRFHYHVTVLGINYRGDACRHDDEFSRYYENGHWPYPMYSGPAGGDSFGIARLIWLCDLTKPDVIVIQNDGWNIPPYVNHLKQFPEYRNVPVVPIVAVDGLNFRGEWLNGTSHVVFWTQFALDEARKGGYAGPATVIPLGVDLKTYYPEDRQVVRKRRIPMLADKFIVGNVNRNQPRKRWDLTIRIFAEWVKKYDVDDAFLYLHTAPTGDVGCDVKQLASYYGILERLALAEPPVFYGISEDRMRDTYNCFDALMSTTQGEGMGLTALEAMACGVPCVLPNWSAFGDWAEGAALLVNCPTTAVGMPYVNVIGGVVDEHAMVEELQSLYEDQGLRAHVGNAGFERANETRFRWADIGERYVEALDRMFVEREANVREEATA